MNVAVYFAWGEQKALEFFTGYVIEKSLSVDNLFVFLLIFTYFKVQPVQQRRVLNFGIIGVVILRGLLILLGTALVKEFHWVMYIFGVVLLYSGYQITFGKGKKIEPDKNIVLKVFRKFIPVSENQDDGQFFSREKGILHATSLFVVLLVIETTDVVFAVDSIPAIFAITTDPLIVFSSNMMAVLGLRSMYFVLEQRPAEIYVHEIRSWCCACLCRCEDACHGFGQRQHCRLSLDCRGHSCFFRVALVHP